MAPPRGTRRGDGFSALPDGAAEERTSHDDARRAVFRQVPTPIGVGSRVSPLSLRLSIAGSNLLMDVHLDPPANWKRGNSSLLGRVRMDNLLKAHSSRSRPLANSAKDVIALLTPGPDGWSPDDWWGFYEERAAIAERDGGVSRDKAEARRSSNVASPNG